MTQTEDDFLGCNPKQFADKLLRPWLRVRESNGEKGVKRVMRNGGGTIVSFKMENREEEQRQDSAALQHQSS